MAAVSGALSAPLLLVDPPDPALAQAVADWVTNGGEAHLDSLGNDFAALEAAAKSNDLVKMGASCQHLQRDVASAQQYDPIPDPDAQRNWAAALAEYARGATDCVGGADTSNMDLMTRASNEIIVGSKDLDKVTARLNQIAG